ncbi:MarR family winged helix-turn-helix transcriptional regulator [Vallicoccus soli]|uniref:MarR family winged helix-turn-helix transcriptional regulator n=1 Tax=Vallicoccus soli TaxID=2339232 RepID=UPI0015AB6073|nr:MarR family transcriptional regulator [Vallicoccus soli]
MTAPAPAPRTVQALYAVVRGLSAPSARDARPPSTWHLLKLLSARPLRTADLAALSALDASTVSRHVSGLEDDGLVRREPDPGDRRSSRIVLTPAGERAYDEAVARRADLLGSATREWADADREALARLLERLADALLPAADAHHPAQEA